MIISRSIHVASDGIIYSFLWLNNIPLGFPNGSLVKNLPAMQALQEMQFRSLGWEDPLEEGMTITPVFLPGESHGQRSLAGCSPWGHKESDTTEPLKKQKNQSTHPLVQVLTSVTLFYLSIIFLSISLLVSYVTLTE